MTVREVTIGMIKKYARISAPDTEHANLYTDWGVDSLSFVTMLTELEDVYQIRFDIAEMEACLQVDWLVAAVESKLEGRDGNDSQCTVQP